MFPSALFLLLSAFFYSLCCCVLCVVHVYVGCMANDKNRWEKDQFFKAAKYQSDVQQANSPNAGMEPNKPERESFEEEANEILGGKKTWRPTWQALGLSYDRSALGRGSTGS